MFKVTGYHALVRIHHINSTFLTHYVHIWHLSYTQITARSIYSLLPTAACGDPTYSLHMQVFIFILPFKPLRDGFWQVPSRRVFFSDCTKKGVLFRLYKEGVFSGHGKRLFPNEKCFQIMKDFQIMKERCFSGHGSSDHGKGDPLLFQIHCKDCHFHDVADADDLQGMLDEAA